MEFPGITTLTILATLLVLGASAANNHNYHDDFLQCLTSQFQASNSATINDVIFTPRNASYASLLQTYYLRPRSTDPREPELMLTPRNESEIQAAILCSKKIGIQIRVRSGGHDYEHLSSLGWSGNPFVVVDMRNFQSISIDAKERTAWVQAGATLGQLYYTIAQTSKTLAFPAGVCPTVGIGGHLSGGGFGMISRKHATAADHIIDATLINANGEILDRESMGEDLFWAIRGGGGTSFGIIIAFKVTLVTVPEKVTVFNVSRTLEQGATHIVNKWQYIADNVDENLFMRLFLHSIRSPIHGRRTIEASFTSLFLGPISDLLPIMQEKFPELGLVEQDCTEMSWIESVLFFAYLPNQTLDVLLNRDEPSTVYGKGKSDYVKEPIPVVGLLGIWKFLNQEDINMVEIQFSPYGGVMNNYSESAIPFPHRAGNIFMIHYAVLWTEDGSAAAERHLNWIRSLYSYMAQYVSKSPRQAYFNYRDLDLGRNDDAGNTSYERASKWGFRYFKNNFRRLVRVKTIVDPSNFFWNEQSVPPLPSFYKDVDVM